MAVRTRSRKKPNTERDVPLALTFDDVLLLPAHSDVHPRDVDLRTSLTSDRGLGAALTSYVRAAGSGRHLTIHLSLKESPFRLPADREVVLFRIAQLVTQDVRESSDADNLWVTLRVDPPSAHLRVEHDGTYEEGRHNVAQLSAVMEGHGGEVHVRPRHGGGVLVDAVFGGGDDGDPGVAG